MDCNRKTNVENCPCTFKGCVRKGFCCECVKHHLKHDELPACFFPKDVERTHDRSFARFIETHRAMHTEHEN